MIYLDNAATTKIDPQVAEAMIPFLKEEYGNPSSKHYTLAKKAEKAVEKSRKNLANLLNCESDELIFTSGASESNNFILKGIANQYEREKKHIITSSIEHKSVLECCKHLEKKGWEVTYLSPTKNGRINPKALEKAIKDNTILISIMWANNELGTLNNIKKLSSIAKENSVFFHTDATQILGKKEINLTEYFIDFLSCSAHKIHGPKGVGAVYIKKDELGFKPDLTPLIHGGNQEYELRAGTLSVHNIVGFGKAAEIASNKMKNYIPKLKNFETKIKNKLKEEISDIKINGDQNNKVLGILNITIPGINNEFIINNLKDKIAISTGSACAIGEPSHVLKAIEMKSSEITSTMRISLSKFNTEEEINQFLKVFIEEIKKYK